MEFWKLEQFDAAPAAIDARSGKTWSYAELRRDALRIAERLPRLGRKSLGMLITQNRYESISAYLGALNAGSAAMLLDPTLNSELLNGLLTTYRPDWIFSSQPEPAFNGYCKSASGEGLFEREEPLDIEIHPDLALLLSTSGSTGSPKLVRLTLKNLAANAGSIAHYLRLTPGERPITSLPMSYSYGLSVINSHLQTGSAIVLSEDGVLRREFWDAIDRHGCTSFAGVPYTYQLLLKTGLLAKKGASLRTLTQAGGRLDEQHIRQMYELAVARNWKFFVMYGQTEASARISYVPFEKLGGKIGSIGVAIPDGSLAIEEQSGELIYRGPNVMLGYAECRQDLVKGDELQGSLRTGDLARQDADGYFYVTGRLKRFLKLFGKRFNLDEVERLLTRRLDSVVACYGEDDLLMAAVENCANPETVATIACEMFDLPRMSLKVVGVKELPRTANGKLDYQRLANVAGDRTLAATH